MSAAIHATYARLEETRFINAFASRSEADQQPVVYYWKPPQYPELGYMSAASDPLAGSQFPMGRVRRSDVAEAERPQRWDYQPDLGALLAEIGNGINDLSLMGSARMQIDLRLAKSGNLGALVRLGTMSEEGRLGVAQGATSDRIAEHLYYMAAKQGDKQAQYRLGVLLARKTAGVPGDRQNHQNDRLAVEWLRKAVTQNHPEAQGELGLMHASGRTGLDPQTAGTQACFWCKKAVDGGVRSPEVLFTVGLMHREGRGDAAQGEESNRAAEEWFTRAATAGHMKAQRELGMMHFEHVPGMLTGEGNDADAAKYLGMAKDQGDPQAAYYLGRMYHKRRALPEGGASPRREALLACLEQAANARYRPAQLMLGELLETGDVDPRPGLLSGQAAAQCYLEAALDGDKDAQCNLADLYRNKKAQPEEGRSRDEAAVGWYKLAAEGGSVRACTAWADMIEAGRAGLEPGPKANSALSDCLKRGAALGDPDLQYRLATWCLTLNAGKSAKLDAEAAAWLEEAAKKNHVPALQQLVKLYVDGRGGIEKGDQANSRAMEYLRRAAEIGDGMSMHALGRWHARGDGGLTREAKSEAERWLTAAARRGVKQAEADLAAVKAGKALESR